MSSYLVVGHLSILFTEHLRVSRSEILLTSNLQVY
jgi:hypothetical protein